MACGRGSAMADAAAVVVTWNALPWVERCLESVRGLPTVVVDNGSTDGTVGFIRERFPEVTLVERPNEGLAAGWNAGMRAAGEPRWYLILNADAWAVEHAVERLVAFGDAHPDAAVVGPRLLNPDGSLQRSVRGFPTLWRLATEYLFLRKLAPRTSALNAFYAGGFDHDRPREAEFLMGACMLVRRAAVEEVGELDESFFLFSEETDWHLRFLAKHHGPREAERARALLRASLVVRGAIFRGERGERYRETARWLGSGDVRALLDRP